MLGYKQPLVKGKAIMVEPVPNVATPEFKELLHDALTAQQLQVSQLAAMLQSCIHKAIFVYISCSFQQLEIYLIGLDSGSGLDVVLENGHDIILVRLRHRETWRGEGAYSTYIRLKIKIP